MSDSRMVDFALAAATVLSCSPRGAEHLVLADLVGVLLRWC